MIRRLVWPLIAIALLVAAATTAPTTRSHASKPHRAPLPELPYASMLVDSARSEIVLELPPTDVPAAGMVRLPVFQAVIPVSAAICHFHMEVVDPAGRRLPQAMLHHFNLSDPERRELFLPIGLHIMAASKETPAATVPRLLFGLPLERGQRLIASGMLGNEPATLQQGVRPAARPHRASLGEQPRRPRDDPGNGRPPARPRREPRGERRHHGRNPLARRAREGRAGP